MDPVSPSQDSAAAAWLLLPHELLLATLALTRPSPNLPASCGLVATALRLDGGGDPTLSRSWRDHVIFHHSSPRLDSLAEAERHINFKARGGQQLLSRLGLFLKSRLPALDLVKCTCEDDGNDDYVGAHNCQYGKHPQVAPHVPLNDPVINQDLVNYLFAAKTGPFARHSVLTSAQIQQQLKSFWTADDQASDSQQFQFAVNHPSHRHWQLLPDAIHLLMFFLHSGNQVLFRHTLSLLHQRQPWLATTSASVFHWSALALDNRSQVRHLFRELMADDPNARVSFRNFLAAFCALDWSTACFDAANEILRVDPAEFVDWICCDIGIMSCVFALGRAVLDPDRYFALLARFETLGVDFDDLFPVAANAGTWTIFLELFNKYDRPLVQEGDQHELTRHILGKRVAELALGKCEGGVEDDLGEVIQFGFENDLMSTEARGILYLQALKDASGQYGEEWVDLITEYTEEHEWQYVFLYGTSILSELSPMSTPLDNSSIHTQEYTPNAQRLAKLLDHLNTRHAITPVEFFIRFARSWDWNQVKSFIHAQLEALVAPLDLVACACQVAEWLNWSMPDKPTALRQMKVLAHLLDMAIAQDAAVTKTRLAQVNRTRLTVMVAACACHLGMHARSKSSNAQQDDAAPIPSAATRAVLIDTWVDMTSSGAGGVACQDLAYGTHRYLPAHLQEHTCALVRRAAAEAEVVADEPVEGDPSELARRIAQGETDLGRALALYIAFDKEYVAEQLRWSGSTPLWVWRQFTAEHSEYRIHYPKTVTDALRHGARVGTTEDVQAIVRHVPLEWWAGSREWLSMLRDFVERKPGSDLREVIATERPKWWEVLSTLESGH